MSETQHGSPLAEGSSHAAQLAAQLAALAMLAVRQVVRHQERQEQQRQDQMAAETERTRGELRVEHAEARLQWAAGLTGDIRQAGVVEATQVWTAAAPWLQRDPAAADASRAAEQRLSEIEPDLMRRYREQLGTTPQPTEAMAAAHQAVARGRYQDFLPDRFADRTPDPALGPDSALTAWEAARRGLPMTPVRRPPWPTPSRSCAVSDPPPWPPTTSASASATIQPPPWQRQSCRTPGACGSSRHHWPSTSGRPWPLAR